VRVIAAGVADYSGITNTNFRGIIEGEKVGVGPFMTEKCSFIMTMTGHTNTITDVRGKIYGGTFSGSAMFVAPSGAESNLLYMVDASAQNVSFQELVVLAMNDTDRDYSGKLDGHVKVGGRMGEGNGRTAAGSGTIGIKNGHIFTMPVFGWFTEFMAKYIPGVNFLLEQSSVKADFNIAGGRVHSGEVLVEGDILSLSGGGDYYFDRNLDFRVKVKLLKKKTALGKVIQFVTDPISELFEFSLKGTLTKPKWSILPL
jgi:hypothetical protein